MTTDDKTAHGRQVERVLWIVLVLNLVVAASKYFYGLASGSASMQADGIHSVFDSLGNVIGLVGISLAARPADAGHPYGHSKFETYGSLAIGVLLLFAAFEVGSSAVEKLVAGTYTAQVTPVSFIVMVGTLVVNLFVTLYERRAGKRLKSEILAADAAHTLSDAFVSIGVIVGLASSWPGSPMADPIHGAARDRGHPRLGSGRVPHGAAHPFRPRAHSRRRHRPRGGEGEWRAVDPCRAHPGHRGRVYCDLHVLVDPQMTVLAAHDLGDEVEGVVAAAFPQIKEVLVHIEPDTAAERAEG